MSQVTLPVGPQSQWRRVAGSVLAGVGSVFAFGIASQAVFFTAIAGGVGTAVAGKDPITSLVVLGGIGLATLAAGAYGTYRVFKLAPDRLIAGLAAAGTIMAYTVFGGDGPSKCEHPVEPKTNYQFSIPKSSQGYKL